MRDFATRRRPRWTLVPVACGIAVCLAFGGSHAASAATASPASGAETVAEPLPDYDALFTQDDAWNGGDAILSVPLSSDKTLWLYGDTFYGPIVDGKRCACITRNSIGIQTGKDPDGASVDFFYGPQKNGVPTSFFTPPAGEGTPEGGWFWPRQGVRTKHGLYIFLTQLVKDTSKPEFIYGKRVASWLVHVPNPDDPPSAWEMSYSKLPWSDLTAEGADQVSVGQAIVRHGLLYIYATREAHTDAGLTRYMMTARVPEPHLGDFDHWRYYDDGRWSKDYRDASSGFEVISPDFSVNYQPALGAYVLVYSDWTRANLAPHGRPKQIVMRTSATPVGPWENPDAVYQCPERFDDPARYCYAAKAHPELASAGNELIVTYATGNARVGSINDVSVYFPRFVRVTWPE